MKNPSQLRHLREFVEYYDFPNATTLAIVVDGKAITGVEVDWLRDLADTLKKIENDE